MNWRGLFNSPRAPPPQVTQIIFIFMYHDFHNLSYRINSILPQDPHHNPEQVYEDFALFLPIFCILLVSRKANLGI